MEFGLAVRVGIAGFGQMGMWHAERAASVRGFALHSVFDITPARRAAAEGRHGCATCSALGEFLSDEALDVVVVATPSHAHVEPVLAALAAGKHVLCEKPIARTEAEAARMFAAAERAGRVLMTFQNRRFDEDFLVTHRVVESGKLGDIHDLRAIRWHYTRLMQTFGIKDYRPQWRSEASYGGGVLLDFGPHLIDQVLLLMPQRVRRVYCELHARRWTRDADDQFLAVLRFENDATAVIDYSHTAAGELEIPWAINGEKAGYRYQRDGGKSKQGGFLYSRSAAGTQRIRPVAAAETDWDALYRNLLAVLKGRGQPAVKPRETLRLMRVLDGLRASAERGEVVRIKDEFAGGVTKVRQAAARESSVSGRESSERPARRRA